MVTLLAEARDFSLQSFQTVWGGREADRSPPSSVKVKNE
jgi:hypothetical protein